MQQHYDISQRGGKSVRKTARKTAGKTGSRRAGCPPFFGNRPESFPPHSGPIIHKFSINSAQNVDKFVDDVENGDTCPLSDKSDACPGALREKACIRPSQQPEPQHDQHQRKRGAEHPKRNAKEQKQQAERDQRERGGPDRTKETVRTHGTFLPDGSSLLYALSLQRVPKAAPPDFCSQCPCNRPRAAVIIKALQIRRTER